MFTFILGDDLGCALVPFCYHGKHCNQDNQEEKKEERGGGEEMYLGLWFLTGRSSSWQGIAAASSGHGNRNRKPTARVSITSRNLGKQGLETARSFCSQVPQPQ